MIRRAALLVMAVALAGAAPAWAHRFHVGIAEVSFNTRTGSLEVVHTYMAHDVEALLSTLHQRQFDMGTPADQALFRQYLERQFWINGATRHVPLKWLGMTADTENITVYQEAPGTPLGQATSIHNAVLADFLPDQVNTVNVKDGANTRTLTFDRAHPERPLR
jgi:hypothetical protein